MEQKSNISFPELPGAGFELKRSTGTLKLDGAEIYFEIWGDGPPLVFAHGLGGNHLSWFQQVPYFAGRYKCIVFSHRGFAISRNVSGDYGASVFADDLSALINHLDLKDVNLVAQSMGGWTALNYALRKNSGLRSLVMASTTGELNFRIMDHPAIADLSKWESESKIIKTELRDRGLLPSTGARMAVEQPVMNFLYRQIYDLTPNSYKDVVRSNIRSARVLDPEVLRTLNIPVLFIAGNEDLVFPPAAAVAASSYVPDGRIEVVDRAGHSVYFERPETFNNLTDGFISRLN